MKRIFALALVLAACSSSRPTPRTSSHALVTVGCIDPGSPPVVGGVPLWTASLPDDGLDDRVGGQAAISYACSQPVGSRAICLRRGRYDVSINPAFGTTNIGSWQVRNGCTDLSITGEGEYATEVTLLGPGIRPGAGGPGDWRLIEWSLGADRGYLAELALTARPRDPATGLGRWDTEEQTHLLHVGPGPLADVRVEHVRFDYPPLAIPTGASCSTAPPGTTCQRPSHGGVPIACSQLAVKAWCAPGSPDWTLLGWFSGGDCVRVFGQDLSPAQAIKNSYFLGINATLCDRSGLGLQRGIDGLTLEDSVLVTKTDQGRDAEPTGGIGYRNVTTKNVTISRGDAPSGGIVFSSGGSSTAGLSSEVVEKVEAIGGSTSIVDVDTVTFKDVVFDSGLSTLPTISMKKTIRRVIFENCTITRPVGAPAGAVIDVTHQSGGFPVEIIIRNSTLVQGTLGQFVNAANLARLSLVNTKLVWTGPAWTVTGAAGINVVNTVAGRSGESVTLQGVTLQAPTGALEELVRIARLAAGSQLGGVTLGVVSATGLRSYVVRMDSAGGTVGKIAATRLSTDAPAVCGGNCP
jgi:hypothetical protein